jgi:hypothetical protein
MNFGCVAHSLNLIFKDLSNPKKGPEWMVAMYKKCNLISNLLNDVNRLSKLLTDTQLRLNCKVKAVVTNCPTRFATAHLVAESVLQCKDALRAMPASSEWDDAVKSVGKDGKKRVETFIETVNDMDFWQALESGVGIMEPVHAAITHLEADAPLLSRVYPHMLGLMNHVSVFEAEEGNESFGGVKAVFEARMEKIMNPTFLASYILDPCHFESGLKKGTYELPTIALEGEKEKELDTFLINKMRAIGKVKKSVAQAELSRATMFDIDGKLASMVTILKTMDSGDMRDGKARFWKLASSQFPNLSKVATVLMGLHATSCASERNWSAMGHIFTKCRCNLDLDTARKMIYIRHNLKCAAAV